MVNEKIDAFGTDEKISEILRELRASNEEEIADEIDKHLMSAAQEQSLEDQEDVDVVKGKLENLKQKLVSDKLYGLSKEVDSRLALLSSKRLDEEDIDALLARIDQQEKELIEIENELKNLKEQTMISYVEYLYTQRRDYYTKYVTSRRYKVITGVAEQIKSYEQSYVKIPLLGDFYTYLLHKAK